MSAKFALRFNIDFFKIWHARTFKIGNKFEMLVLLSFWKLRKKGLKTIIICFIRLSIQLKIRLNVIWILFPPKIYFALFQPELDFSTDRTFFENSFYVRLLSPFHRKNIIIKPYFQVQWKNTSFPITTWCPLTPPTRT